jgi:hypothetical protein
MILISLEILAFDFHIVAHHLLLADGLKERLIADVLRLLKCNTILCITNSFTVKVEYILLFVDLKRFKLARATISRLPFALTISPVYDGFYVFLSLLLCIRS